MFVSVCFLPVMFVRLSFSMFLKALVFILTHTPYDIRRQVSSKVKKMISSLGGAQLSVDLAKEFRTFLSTQKVIINCLINCLYILISVRLFSFIKVDSVATLTLRINL